MILKEINHVNRIQIQPTPKEERKRTWRQSNLSHQEKLYADILASEIKRKRGKEGKENKDRRFSERQTRNRERRRLEKRREEEAWLEKFREWSPTQEWPITKEWKRCSRLQGQQKNRRRRQAQTQRLPPATEEPRRGNGTTVGEWAREYKSGMLG